MNWNTKSEEQLENLPKREKTIADPDRDRYWGWNFPYRRLQRWLESNVGRHIDSVIHDYVTAEWIPKEFRQAHYLSKYVEVNTFMENGKVCFYESFGYFVYATDSPYRVVENEGVRTFYIHPKTRLLCVHRPPTRKSWQKKRQEELNAKVRFLGDYWQFYKENGVWFEVKGEPIKYAPSFFGNRKGPKDILLEDKTGWRTRGEEYPHVRVILKRQLNHKELVKHGLQNDTFNTKEEKCPKCGGYGNICIHEQKKKWLF